MVWVSVQRTIGGVVQRFIEVFTSEYFTLNTDPVRLDASSSYNASPATVFSDLDYLNGETVGVQADGLDIGNFVVSGGKVTLPTPASVVHVGLRYTGKLQLLPNNPQTKMQKISLSTLRVYKSIGGKLGVVDQFGNLVGAGLLALPYLTTTPLLPSSEDLEIPPDSTFDKNTSVLIQQDAANPFYVLAATQVAEAFER